MQTLQINTIPFKHTIDTKIFGFVREKRVGDFPVHRSNLPRYFWDNHKHDVLEEQKYLYTNFTDTANCDFVVEVDFKEGDNKFVKHYYSQLILEYFKDIVDVVGYNFVNDVEVWFKDSSLSNALYNAYQKFTIKVHFSFLAKGPALCVSFDGVTRVTTQNLADLNIPTDDIKTVIYQGQQYSYKFLPDEAKQNLEECYLLLSRTLAELLNIELPEHIRVKNKYPSYYKKINHLFIKYLNTPDFISIIDISNKGFIKVEDEHCGNTVPESNVLRFYDNTHTDPKEGMKTIGPYKPAKQENVRFFFIYHEPDRDEYVTKLYNCFKDGLPPYVPSLNRIIKQPFFIDEGTSLGFSALETALSELKVHLRDLEKVPNTKYLAIYISPIDKFERKNHEVYYQIKEELLKYEINSQVVFKDKINDDYFGLYIYTMAPAILAKLGGVPWRLDREPSTDLVIGVGAFNSHRINQRYLGSAFCFNNDGEFKGFDCLLENELDLLAGAIGKQILQYKQDYGQQASRLIIHYYKQISKREIDPIISTLEKLGLDIPVVVVTINKTESNDFVAFDASDKNLMPYSGSYIKIFRNQYLLFNNARYTSADNNLLAYPFPIKLKLFCTDEYYFDSSDNVDAVIDQVYQFSRMYWKSNRQQNMPVTIKYPEMVAEMFAHFESNALSGFAKNNLWFL